MRDLRRDRANAATPTITATILTLIQSEEDPFTSAIMSGTPRSPQAEQVRGGLCVRRVHSFVHDRRHPSARGGRCQHGTGGREQNEGR